ncbi:EscU/YscU/HrcU family type III secretion system export apparatus switch protein [Desulfolithobacter sp.]
MDKPTGKKSEKAVALLYDQEKSTAPQVVASGSGQVAQNIIQTARDAGVFIQEDPDLVELLAKVPVGKEIPEDLYRSVADILAFVYLVNEKYKSAKRPQK